MCGIVGYIGSKEAYPIIIKGLKRLEYRGYDSAGVALLEDAKINLYKKQGKVSKLVEFAENKNKNGHLGIGHTRWATHGEPNDVNSHPHLSNSGNLVMIHNGIIENYAAIKAELEKRGYVFHSETDTEVLLNLIEDIHVNEKVSLGAALRKALNHVIGAYAIALIDKNEPNKLYAARKSSPLVVGIGDNEYFVASDASPIIEYTKNVMYLDDEEIAILEPGKEIDLFTIQNKEKTPYIQELEIQLEAIEKGGYDHFMLKEIYEQPKSIRDSMRGRLNLSKGIVNLGGIQDYEQALLNANRIVIVACGTSWHAGLVGEYLFEDFARIPVEVEYASEFRYRNPVIYENDIVIAISQSGETADTLAAIELAKSKGATVFGVCNVVGSSISRATHAGSYTHAGPEIGVASTKAFTAQITVLTLMALSIGHKKGTVPASRYRSLLNEINSIPKLVERCLKTEADIKEISARFQNASNFLYLGRGYSFPVALEGALKLKEISYIHAEGYPAAEMKHGPIALITKEMPVVVIATKGPSYEKVVSNIQEVKARKGVVIAITTEGDVDVKAMADYTIEIPEIEEALVPFLSVVPLQLLSYHIAVLRGCNVDQPRNLAKSVTVE
ncbi:glutamine--fructose-6-phosphate transaminase (isomerizing) [Salibacteraceae bacterium]|nr:glutamine--fructose-6-phosphate transaminase (isomerizing) [Crocinitomicaceae bacterium]MDA7730417.1 glutamine--fructose-6-phosphate transaminase (isomerizing) [Salibacteraceae bacterium]MDA9938391.1 glutamine--fructose-6-phosphate transaminase (isomerizing) [Salibacteraceae bacterium]MDB9725330.1 glutamine--fructose-6-phosphate transaminase (isomerizing) [Salibacteraceae bacterium]MDC1204138.1 glutamine--fructose-6-phosphate transaminase (isomerizing) [Salibacteraceae bacterium]|tara:strand:+ start:49167 stop:51008 length:1842 start_codon:yes stop_codon:yes gene_type:complete